MAPGDVLQGHPHQPPLLQRCDGGQRATKGMTRSGLDLDEDEHITVALNEVNFAMASPIPAGKDCVASATELAAGGLLSRFSKLRLMTGGHTEEPCNR